MRQPLIQFFDVYKRFGDLSVFNGLNLNIYKGEVTTVVGQRGAGKSLLLHHIAGMMQPDSGKVLFNGEPPAEVSEAGGCSRPQKISCIFRGTTLFDSLTVFENIALPLRDVPGMPVGEIAKRAGATISQLDLERVSSKFPFQLPGEVRKYVILARALVSDPEVVLFDQPATGMDPIRKNAVHSAIADCQNRLKFTAIITSYDIPDVFEISHRIALLEGGEILFEGRPEEIGQADDPVIGRLIRETEDGDERSPDARRMAPNLPERPYPGDFALVILRVDNLDEIREKLGGEASAKALVKLGKQIQSHVRGVDRCVIRQPDKIQIQLPHTDMEQSRQVCAKLAEAMRSGKIEAVQPGPGTFFAIHAGYAQARGDSPVEQVVALAESMQTPFYKFDFESVNREC